jgi:hypothetical protein
MLEGVVQSMLEGIGLSFRGVHFSLSIDAPDLRVIRDRCVWSPLLPIVTARVAARKIILSVFRISFRHCRISSVECKPQSQMHGGHLSDGRIRQWHPTSAIDILNRS